MEDIRSVLAYRLQNKEDFDPKLVAREETGCCHSPQTYETSADNDDAPCNR